MATPQKGWALRSLIFQVVEEGQDTWFWQVMHTEPLEHRVWLRGYQRCEAMCVVEEMGGPECRWASTIRGEVKDESLLVLCDEHRNGRHDCR